MHLFVKSPIFKRRQKKAKKIHLTIAYIEYPEIQ